MLRGALYIVAISFDKKYLPGRRLPPQKTSVTMKLEERALGSRVAGFPPCLLEEEVGYIKCSSCNSLVEALRRVREISRIELGFLI